MTIPNGEPRRLTPREMRGMPKELREIVKAAQGAGWSVWKTRRSHLRFRPPAGSPRPRVPSGHEDHRAGATSLTTGTTPSDMRGLDNLRADLRGYGLEGV
ncbi:HicA-like toxin [Streptomyces phage LazerLemon]|nr:HicA-like toxin [Streptomyces phage LazerLemon]